MAGVTEATMNGCGLGLRPGYGHGAGMNAATAAHAFSAGRPLRIGSRGSPLALAQARMAAAAICRQHGLPEAAAAIHIFKTTGDRVQDRALADIGGKALWTRELDRALLDSEIDVAVHSMKDVETWLPEGIALAAVLPRADPRDRLIGVSSLADLPAGALVGTSSPRREAQLRHRRPDVRVGLLRGNVETRLRRVEEGAFAATFLAAAGLERLSMPVGAPLAIDDWLPAAQQAVVGITCRAGDQAVLPLLAAIEDKRTRICLDAERAFLAALGGSCRTAVAAHARLDGDGLVHLAAELFSPDGDERVAADATAASPGAVGAEVAARLLALASAALRGTLTPASSTALPDTLAP